MTNSEIAKTLHDLADAMEMTGAVAFRVKAVRGGARIIETLNEPALERLQAKTLTEVKGIGEGIARRVEELATTGKIAELEDLRGRLSPGLLEIAKVEGIGPKTAQLIHEKLGIASLDELEAAGRRQALRTLPRLGPKKEEQILAAIDRARTSRGRIRLDRAEREAEPILAELRKLPGVERAEIAGSLRRRKDTIGDVDILITTSQPPAPIMTAFCSMPWVEAILAQGPTKSSIKTRLGLQIDVRVVAHDSFGAALHYFTGSKDHNVAIRALGVKKGIKINEYGVFDERGGAGGKKIGGVTEEEIFASVGLPWIPPELRENAGEIEAALQGRLPKLIELADLRGDLHMHTVATDGSATLEEMVQAALALGHEYIAITDHSQNLKMVRGLDADRLAAQAHEIAELNQKYGGKPRILHGIEADILVDGTIDLGADVLGRLDWVIGSVHSHFQLPRAEQTRRIIAAMESGQIDVVGHPTGRLLEERAPYDLDMEAIIAAAVRTGVALECNAYPERLDLNDVHCRMARERGAWVVIDTDSHATLHLRGLKYGVQVARRGGLEAKHVLNTRSADELMAHKRTRLSG